MDGAGHEARELSSGSDAEQPIARSREDQRFRLDPGERAAKVSAERQGDVVEG